MRPLNNMPETRPLPIVSRAHPTRDVDRLSSGIRWGEAVIPRPGGRWPLRFLSRAPPYPPSGSFGRTTAGYVDRPQATMGSRHRLGTALGPVGDRPSPLWAGDPTPITQVKVHTRAKSRVSIETRELRLSSREYDFPGINISSCECILLAAISVSVNCCDSDGAGSGYQPMMGSSAQPPVVYGLNNSMQASCNALIATADGDLL